MGVFGGKDGELTQRWDWKDIWLLGTGMDGDIR
jgi:hypothetical protein